MSIVRAIPRWVVTAGAAVAVVPASAVPARAADGVTPSTFSASLEPGEHVTITKTVTTPEILPKPDIYFLADTTGSMTPVLENVIANAETILAAVDATANDPRYGAGQYRDFPTGGGFAYRNDAAIPSTDDNGAAALAAIGAWTASGGGDFPEANLFALHKLVTEAGFRPDSSGIVVWFGDAPGHDPVCSAISGEATVTEASVIAELQAANIQVIAVSSTTGVPDGLDGDPVASSSDYEVCGSPGGSPGQATRIANATGGLVFKDVAPEDVADAILAGLASLPVTVTPTATCDSGLTATFDPAEETVLSGTTVTFAETLTLDAGVTHPAALTCTVDFLLNGLSAGAAFVETNTIQPILNQPPVCTGVRAGPSELWSPNHKFVTVVLSGATDPDGDATTLTITGVTQDEALNGTGDGDTTPDAAWVSNAVRDRVKVRAERSGGGDGRVYRISFTVRDENGDTCTGTTNVGVPHDQGHGPAVDTTSVVVNSFGS
ncbi:vWA domain-containing protein [Polyangium mundeleinium]|uniref:VWA domain-containing protein n=1 Tax=Polyangium mundeleinium TaxID=2995306 RepID=A0ABT5EYH0_9BACT|nr:vWA domain-containing protein [Polyangium mundeleinium]MDC0745855.1 VWA domain-containing protein [Polyangium mundeleinium]